MKKYKILKDFPGNSEKIGDIIRFHIGTFPEYFGQSGKRYCAKDIENYPEFLQLIKQAPKIGTKVKIKGIVSGCYGMEGKIGIVTNEVGRNGLLGETDYVGDLEAFNIKVNDNWIGRVACTDWQEVVELDYEILKEEYIPGQRVGVVLSKEQFRRRSYKITSILRKSDNEVFSVGDLVQLSIGKDLWWASDNCKICSFKIHDNKLSFGIEQNTSKGFYSHPLQDWRRVKKPLFVTEDGIGISAGNKCYGVDFMYYNCGMYCWPKSSDFTVTSLIKGHKYFSTNEAAQAYIDENKN